MDALSTVGIDMREKAWQATLDHLLDPKNVKELQEVLELHVIAGTLT